MGAAGGVKYVKNRMDGIICRWKWNDFHILQMMGRFSEAEICVGRIYV
jgi:hypothetical protein